jgi:glycosyltransferase involved in cell wall biosynthesis
MRVLSRTATPEPSVGVPADRADVATLPPGTRIVICNWRDLRHPEGGGSELFVETVARRLAADGHHVTLLCQHAQGAPDDEVVDGVTYRRRGGRHSHYLHAALALALRRARPDVVLDVQNGVPFLSRLAVRAPVVCLVHHVHREQWSVVFGPRVARFGWWLESRLGPALYRHSRYVAVSEATRAELATLGVSTDRVSVVHNGSPAPLLPRNARSPSPRIVVLGRLVPHKRVEIALRAVAALRDRFPDVHVDVVGEGYWHSELTAEVARLGLDGLVTLHGHVDEQAKADLLAAAWVLALPSLKEGWGLAVVEAAALGTPAVAFAEAGGVRESIVDGSTGVLVPAGAGQEAFTAALAELLSDRAALARMGAAARAQAGRFTWAAAEEGVAAVLAAALAGR